MRISDWSSDVCSSDLQHLLGTDNLGRDVFARIIYGGRYTLFLGIIAVSIATIFGVPIGLISGYFGGAADMVIQRIADVRSEERRVGKECVRTCRSRWSKYH